MHVARQAIQLGDDDRRPPALPAGLGERISEFRTAIERVRAFARFDLDMFGDDLETFGLGKPGDG